MASANVSFQKKMMAAKEKMMAAKEKMRILFHKGLYMPCR